MDVAGNLARTLLLPALPGFLARHPGPTVHLGEGERFDLIREGFDCVVSAGSLDDSEMTARRLGVMEELTCASPAYLARHGTPVSPDALDGHVAVGFVSSRTRALVNTSDMSAAAALLGPHPEQPPACSTRPALRRLAGRHAWACVRRRIADVDECRRGTVPPRRADGR